MQVHSALSSPNSGIADFSAVTRHVASSLDEQAGCDVHLQFEADKMVHIDGVVEIHGETFPRYFVFCMNTARHVEAAAG